MLDLSHHFNKPHLGLCEPQNYSRQLALKVDYFQSLLADHISHNLLHQIQIHASPKTAYRSRIEFAIKPYQGQLAYLMFDPITKQPIRIDWIDSVLPAISEAMPKLLKQLQQNPILANNCFQVNFRANRQGQLLISLIYRCSLDKSAWLAQAISLQQCFGWHLIGRYRGGMLSTGQLFLDYDLECHGRCIRLRQLDNTFSQPNPTINEAMLSFALDNLTGLNTDLLELYCGNAAFSIALSDQFNRILATEVVRQSLNLARHNCQANAANNILLARLTATETHQALTQQRTFRRLQNINLPSLKLNTLLVDPPRCGLCTEDLSWFSKFEHILYFSCNPESFKRDLKAFSSSHTISRLAVFDQFPYTAHLECAALFVKK